MEQDEQDAEETRLQVPDKLSAHRLLAAVNGDCAAGSTPLLSIVLTVAHVGAVSEKGFRIDPNIVYQDS